MYVTYAIYDIHIHDNLFFKYIYYIPVLEKLQTRLVEKNVAMDVGAQVKDMRYVCDIYDMYIHHGLFQLWYIHI